MSFQKSRSTTGSQVYEECNKLAWNSITHYRYKIKFGLEEIQYTEKTCIIVMEVFIDNQKVLIGSLVDEVMSVMEFSNKDIMPPPSIGNKFRSEFITEVIEENDQIIMILDINKIYSADEINMFQENTQEVASL